MPYPILEVFPAGSERVEQLGSKPKFWFRWDAGDRPWLFKYARPDTGEHWAEKVAAEVAHLLGLSHAIIELAVFEGKAGSASPTFAPRGVNLIHGNEILAGRVLKYDPHKKFKQNEHTFRRIVKAFYDVFHGKDRTQTLTMLAGYLTLDALICNVDRHHENWGILRSTGSGGKHSKNMIAPTFDHASSLGRELRDKKRASILSEKRIGDYIAKGAGAIYWQETDPKGENPLQLCIRAARIFPSYFAPWIQRLKEIRHEELDLLVSEVPNEFMSPIAKEFARAILLYTANELRGL